MFSQHSQAIFYIAYTDRINSIAVAQQQQTNNVMNVIALTFCVFQISS